MRIGLFADSHANREALTACLEHAHGLGCDRLVFLGDLVGYGADPAWVIDTVRRHQELGAAVVLGNHDQAVLQGPDRTTHDDARQVLEWTRSQLDAEHLAFLSNLPLLVEEEGRLYVHANAWDPPGWSYIRSAGDAARSLGATACRLTFCGHLHTQALYHQGPMGRIDTFSPAAGIGIPLGALRRWVAVLGAVGQPRDGDPAACYALFDAGSAVLTFQRVPYDTALAARKIRGAGLPDWLGARLEVGG